MNLFGYLHWFLNFVYAQNHIFLFDYSCIILFLYHIITDTFSKSFSFNSDSQLSFNNAIKTQLVLIFCIYQLIWISLITAATLSSLY